MSRAAADPAAAAGAPRWARPWNRGSWVRGAAITLVISLAVGFLMAINDDPRYMRMSLALAVATGLGVYVLARGFISLSWKRLLGLDDRRRMVAMTAIFAASGMAAWSITMLVARAVFTLPLSRSPVPMAITGGIAVGTGLTFYAYDRIRGRLEASIARLKETEFAQKELQLARELQSRLLPPAETAGDGYRIAARNLPAQLVAGDFYDIFRLPDGTVGVAVGDVAGKGMAAALIMASAKAMLPLLAADRTAAETLREANRRLAAELPGREFVALALLRLQPATGEVELANAGLPDPYLLTPGGEPRALSVPGPRLPLAVRAEVEYGSLTLRLAPGDRLLLLTDGMPEAPLAAGGEPLGYPAFGGLLTGAARDEPPLAAVDGLIGRVRGLTQPQPEDDWTAVLIESTAMRRGQAAGSAGTGDSPSRRLGSGVRNS